MNLTHIAALSLAVPTLVQLALAEPVRAQDRRLDGAGVTLALTDRTLVYDNGASQIFTAGGATTYDSGTPSQGRWSVREDRYCSVWPPSDRWACYDLTLSDDGQIVTFVADDGSTTAGRYAQ